MPKWELEQASAVGRQASANPPRRRLNAEAGCRSPKPEAR